MQSYTLSCSFSGRVGKIRVLSFKIGLVTMARAHLEDKYKCKYSPFMYSLVLVVRSSLAAFLVALKRQTC